MILGCDRSGADKLPQQNDDFPAVVELGELDVMTSTQLTAMQDEIRSTIRNGGTPAPSEWCDSSADLPRESVGDRLQADGNKLCHYGQLGVAQIGETGGATFTFQGTGAAVCLIVDPETVYWNQSVARESPRIEYSYPELEEDDGDIDLFAGLSAYYTGSPGIELGNFRGFYTDSLGNQTEIEYGLCTINGSNDTIARAGRGTAEFCTIDTANTEGIEHTVVLETWSVPLNDGVVSYGVALVSGRCSDVNECTLLAESLDFDNVPKECTPQLEAAFCERRELATFCCVHPDMCGEDVTDIQCNEIFDEYDVRNAGELRDVYCDEAGKCCDP